MARLGAKDRKPSGYNYEVDDQVYVDDTKLYRCVLSHTSGASFDLDITNWLLISDAYSITYEVESFSSPSVGILDSGVKERVLLMDCTANSITINLATSSDLSGVVLHIKKIDASSVNTVTIIPNGTETIDGDSTHTILPVQWTSITLVTDGSDWFLI